ncbi:4-alpha-glucanotransferase [Candidatus Spongiihabitans sp.]|uniref:4-alpha-glucanotransferase n=1 Tax=Candidatus Spongiihabitans sp. TaxID=3101308 RepID=UPI003C7AC51E
METKQINRAILPTGRRAGVGMHFSSLPGAYGIGDIADSAQAFIEALANMHIGVWQFLPTGPTAYADSPYQPLSAFAGNENLIGIEPLIRAGLISSDEAQALKQLPHEFVDYGRLIPAKNVLLATAADRFSNKINAGKINARLTSRYDEFLHSHGPIWLDDYALYRVLKTRHGERPWPQWQPPYRYREATAISRIRASSAKAIERIKITQFLFDQQWRALRACAAQHNIRLFADMPIYIALDSVDAWARPQCLRIDHNGQPAQVAGTPPDYFSEHGQLWGNPLYDWDYHAANGYQWWIDRLRHAATMADLIRIDHFRGFEAYWAIPAESDTARHGVWEAGPGDALFDALRDALSCLPIVAEDLGVITAQVDALRLRHQIPGMKVLQFEVSNPDFQLSDIRQNCVCYTATHDNDTTVGWFRDSNHDTCSQAESEAARANALRLTGGTADTINTDMIGLAFSSAARLAVAPMQDYLGLGGEARLNIPATTEGNWRWRLQSSQLAPAFHESVMAMVHKSSRG